MLPFWAALKSGCPQRRAAGFFSPAVAQERRSCGQLCGSLGRRQHRDTERQEMLRVAGDDDELMGCGGPGNHGVSHARVVTG